ncbi:STAS domain-containing protein [Streptomyces sp. NPDC017993]|uniref:STAS domain-containing protein n=1 Tax=Streptomyces sp. NPDC017993 TaxID=3365027 RepID=UPI003794390A
MLVVWQERDALVVAVSGHLDLDNIAPLGETLRKAAEDGAGPVVVDLSAVTFADSTTVNVLLQAHAALGPALRLAAPSDFLERLFTLTGLDTVLPLHESVAKAIDADPSAPLGADGGDREG